MKKTHDIVNNYLNTFSQDKINLEKFIKFNDTGYDIFNRKNFNGHIVANSLVINKENQVLTIFHNKLQMYLQPGGHVELTDKSIIEASQRELEEETGIIDFQLHPWHIRNNIPIFIESHFIPENIKKNEENHYHHDFMYIFLTNSNNISLQLDEVSDYKWTEINKVIKENPESFIAKSLIRMQELKII